MENESKQVVNRAKRRTNLRLRALQTFASAQEFLSDEHVLFGLSEFVAHRKLDCPDSARVSWYRKRSPIPLEHYSRLESYLSEGQELLTITERFAPKIKGVIERAIYWISKSIEEVDTDLKIITLCTAMETLLTIKSDKRKGEAIAYRMALLELQYEETIRHPVESLWVYELRSKIIHGSSIEVTTKAEYFTLLRDTRNTLRKFIRYADKTNITKQSDLIKSLETSEIAERLLYWLDEYSDESSGSIEKALSDAKEGHKE